MGEAAGLVQTGLGFGGRMYAGRMQNQSDTYAANVLGQEAGASVASGIQGAIADKRYTNYVTGNAAARAAGSGTTGTSPSVLNVIGDIQSQGEYKALTSLYAGEDRANELAGRAAGFRREGAAAQTSGWLSGDFERAHGRHELVPEIWRGRRAPGAGISGTGILTAGAEMA